MNAVLGALAGATATALFGAFLSYFNYRRQRRRLLDIAALRCLDRLRKIKAGYGGHPPRNDSEIERLPDAQRKTVRNELRYLGPDLDRYLESIGSAWPRARSNHFALYEKFRPIVIGHDLSTVSNVASELEPFTFPRKRRVLGSAFLRERLPCKART
jgi:hypothetical protein